MSHKLSRWPENPDHPHFKICVHRRGALSEIVDFAPERWASNRRDLCGWSWPSRKHCGMNFADVVSATELQTGAVLSRVGLWLSVLHHRDDAPPWYVQWADQHLMVLCLIGFARQELGHFKATMRPQVNEALQAVGCAPLDEDGFKSITQAMREGYNGCMTLREQVPLLTNSERVACRNVAKAMLESKKLDVGIAQDIF